MSDLVEIGNALFFLSLVPISSLMCYLVYKEGNRQKEWQP